MIITMDGPAGVGKSTAARRLAEKLGIAYLDSGATYRAVTLRAIRNGVDLADENTLAEVAKAADIKLVPCADKLKVLLNGEDVSDEIRRPDVTKNAHYAAGSPMVRHVLVELQQRMGRQLGDFIAEGRDQGSVVFPDADLKFYFDASAHERAQRRREELAANGIHVDHNDLLAEIQQRDDRDRSRPVAPLIRPEGAINIDTSGKTIEQVQQELLSHVERFRCR